MAIYKPTDCSPFNGVFDVTDKNAFPIYLECKIDSANTPVSAYSIEIYDSENKRVFPTGTNPVEDLVTMVSDLRAYTSKDPFNIKAPTNTGYNGTYLKIPFVVKTVDNTKDSTVSRNQTTNKNEKLTNGGRYYWAITLYQEITKDGEKIVLPSKSKYYDMPVVVGQVIGSDASRLQTELVPQVVNGYQTVNSYQTLNDLVLQDKYVQLYKSEIVGEERLSEIGTRTIISSFDYLYGHIMPSNTSVNTISSEMVRDASCLKVFKFGNDPSVLGTTDKVDFFYNGEIAEGTTGNTSWVWVTSFADASQSYWKEEITYSGATNKPTAPYFPFGSNGPQISGNERIIFNGCVQKQYNGIFRPGDISIDEIKNGEDITGYKLTIIWYRTTDANNWGSLSNKIVYVNGPSYETGDEGYTGTNVQVDAFQQFGTINQTPFVFVREKPIKLRNNVDKKSVTDDGAPATYVGGVFKVSTSNPIASISSITTPMGGQISVQNYIFEPGTKIITIYEEDIDFGSGTPQFNVSYYPYDENEYRTAIFKNAPPTKDANGNPVDGKLYLRPATNISKDMIFKETTSSIYSRWFRILDFNIDFYYATYQEVYKYSQNGNDSAAKDLSFEVGQRYQIKSFFKKSDYNPFDLYASPNIATSLYLVGKDDVITPDEKNVYTIKGRNIRATATYEQNDYIWWESYQWVLYAADNQYIRGEVLQQTDEMYSGEIGCVFYGLTGENSRKYVLSLIIKTNAGAIIEKTLNIATNFSEDPISGADIQSTFDCDSLAVNIDIDMQVNLVVPNFSKDDYLFQTDPTNNPTIDKGAETYTIKPDSGIIAKYNNSTVEKPYSDITTTMMYKAVAPTDGSGAVSGFQNYAKAAFLTGKDKYKYEEIVVPEKDMVVEYETTINSGNDNSSKEYVGNIFSMSNTETGETLSLSVPEPIVGGIVNPKRNQFVWKTTGKDDKDANNGAYWQDNEEYVTVSNWQKDGYYITKYNRTNVADIKYINDNGTGKFDKTYINPMGAGDSDIGFSTYGTIAAEPSKPDYVVHDIVTKQSAFDDNKKYVAYFQSTEKEGAETGGGIDLAVRGVYASLFSIYENPAKPYEDPNTDVPQKVLVGKSDEGECYQYKSVFRDAENVFYFRDDNIVYFGNYYNGSAAVEIGGVTINDSVVKTKKSLSQNGADFSGDGLQKIKKIAEQNVERQQLNGQTITVKAKVSKEMNVSENTYWIEEKGR